VGKWFPAFKTLCWMPPLPDAFIHPVCTLARPKENVGTRIAEVVDVFQSDSLLPDKYHYSEYIWD